MADSKENYYLDLGSERVKKRMENSMEKMHTDFGVYGVN